MEKLPLLSSIFYWPACRWPAPPSQVSCCAAALLMLKHHSCALRRRKPGCGHHVCALTTRSGVQGQSPFMSLSRVNANSTPFHSLKGPCLVIESIIRRPEPFLLVAAVRPPCGLSVSYAPLSPSPPPQFVPISRQQISDQTTSHFVSKT